MIRSSELVAHSSAAGSRPQARAQISAHSWGAVARSAAPAWISSRASPRTSPAALEGGHRAASYPGRLSQVAAAAQRPVQGDVAVRRGDQVANLGGKRDASLRVGERRRDVARRPGEERPDGQDPGALPRRPRVPERYLVRSQCLPARRWPAMTQYRESAVASLAA